MQSALLLGCGLTLLASAADDAPYKVTPDRATITIADAGKTLVVTSPKGIGKARIELVAEAWPRSLTLRIGIKGLEGFTCRNERLEIRGALGRDEVEVRRRGSIREDWSPSKISREPRLVARRKGESIEVEIPGEMLSREANILEVEWIDFYRG